MPPIILENSINSHPGKNLTRSFFDLYFGSLLDLYHILDNIAIAGGGLLVPKREPGNEH